MTTALVFNCGMGAVRTTFAMVAACIIRRKQLIVRGMDDPYTSKVAVPKPLAVSVRVRSLLAFVGSADSARLRLGAR